MSQNQSMVRHRLDDSNWNKIYACLKTLPRVYTGNEEKSRIFVDAVHWIMRTGAQWRDLPGELGQWNSVFKRFGRWSDKGIWDQLHEHFIEDPDLEWLLIDRQHRSPSASLCGWCPYSEWRSSKAGVR